MADLEFWAQVVVVPVSILGVIITLIWHQKIAKHRATLDIILVEQSDAFLLEQRRKFSTLRDTSNIIEYAVRSKIDTPEVLTIRSILNFNELIAIGISNKAVDARLYKRYCRTDYVDDWIGCKPFVMELRRESGNPTYYCELEKRAKKWANTEEQKRV